MPVLRRPGDPCPSCLMIACSHQHGRRRGGSASRPPPHPDPHRPRRGDKGRSSYKNGRAVVPMGWRRHRSEPAVVASGSRDWLFAGGRRRSICSPSVTRQSRGSHEATCWPTRAAAPGPISRPPASPPPQPHQPRAAVCDGCVSGCCSRGGEVARGVIESVVEHQGVCGSARLTHSGGRECDLPRERTAVRTVGFHDI
jgi:hypothetical protein